VTGEPSFGGNFSMHKGGLIVGGPKKSRYLLENATPALAGTSRKDGRICLGVKAFREVWRIEVDVNDWRDDIIPCGFENHILK
jgi:hypothetical protein